MKSPMWKTQVFNGPDLILEHAQNDYWKVIRFTIQSLVELVNASAQDFRVVTIDQSGAVCFLALGPNTQTADAATPVAARIKR